MTGTATDFFRRLDTEGRKRWKQSYEHLILIEEDKYPTQYYPAWDKHRAGKPRPYPPKMPWMYKSWTQGLAMLKAVMIELGELTADVKPGEQIKIAL